MDNPLKGIDGQLMIMAAHRYCLGRQSYIVGAALDWLWKHREHFENNTKFVIVRDTVEALMDGHTGADFDTKGWHNFALNLYNEMSSELQSSVRRAVAHKREPWPLSSDYCSDCGRIYYNCVCSHEGNSHE
jgi:hypothetical protein